MAHFPECRCRLMARAVRALHYAPLRLHDTKLTSNPDSSSRNAVLLCSHSFCIPLRRELACLIWELKAQLRSPTTFHLAFRLHGRLHRNSAKPRPLSGVYACQASFGSSVGDHFNCLCVCRERDLVILRMKIIALDQLVEYRAI